MDGLVVPADIRGRIGKLVVLVPHIGKNMVGHPCMLTAGGD